MKFPPQPHLQDTWALCYHCDVPFLLTVSGGLRLTQVFFLPGQPSWLEFSVRMWGHSCYKRADLLLRCFAVISHTYISFKTLQGESYWAKAWFMYIQDPLVKILSHPKWYMKLGLDGTANPLKWGSMFYFLVGAPAPPASSQGAKTYFQWPFSLLPQGPLWHTHIFPERRNCSPKY